MALLLLLGDSDWTAELSVPSRAESVCCRLETVDNSVVVVVVGGSGGGGGGGGRGSGGL